MRINYNQSAVLANACLNRTDNAVSNSIQRLSSGLKINHSKDNPAGLAISHRMDSQIKGLNVANSNTNDGISVVETADGAMSEISSMLQRMNQLAVQAGTDSMSDDDRALINDEVKQLKEEITRIVRDTEFNGQPLLDGTFDLKGYTNNENIKVDYYSDEVIAGKYNLNLAGLIIKNADGTYEVDKSKISASDAKFDKLSDINATYDGEILKITAAGNFEMDIATSFGNATGMVELDITGVGAMKVQVGANEGQELAVRIPEISLKKMGIDDLEVTSYETAQAAIDSIKGAMNYLSSERSRLGAYENRMEHNVANLEVSEENMTASYSRIMDVDMAEEMTEYTTQQVLQQAGISMLSQANEMPQQILQLLQ